MMLEAKPTVDGIIMTAYEIESEDIALTLPIVTHEELLKKHFSMKRAAAQRKSCRQSTSALSDLRQVIFEMPCQLAGCYWLFDKAFEVKVFEDLACFVFIDFKGSQETDPCIRIYAP